jgi:RING-H2 zinc finger domain
MSESPKKRVCILLFVVFVFVILILVYVFGSAVLYFSFPIFLFATAVGFCHACIKALNERNRETPPQDLQQPPVQNLPQRPDEHIEINTENSRSRSSMGRILKPVEDEESSTCLESFPNHETDCTPCVNSPAKQRRPLQRSVLSADFGDNEILAVEESACTICLVYYQHGEEIQRNEFLNVSSESTTCDHIFHPNCISTWIESSGKPECPCCRRPFHLTLLPR